MDDLLVKKIVATKNETFRWPPIHNMQFRAGSLCIWFKHKSFGDFQFIRRGKNIEKHILQPLYNIYPFFNLCIATAIPGVLRVMATLRKRFSFYCSMSLTKLLINKNTSKKELDLTLGNAQIETWS